MKAEIEKKDARRSQELVQGSLKICSLEIQLTTLQAQSSTDRLAIQDTQAENADLKDQLDKAIGKLSQLEDSKDQLIRQVEEANEKSRQDEKTKQVCDPKSGNIWIHTFWSADYKP